MISPPPPANFFSLSISDRGRRSPEFIHASCLVPRTSLLPVNGPYTPPHSNSPELTYTLSKPAYLIGTFPRKRKNGIKDVYTYLFTEFFFWTQLLQ